jgi:hypothetical protein
MVLLLIGVHVATAELLQTQITDVGSEPAADGWQVVGVGDFDGDGKAATKKIKCPHCGKFFALDW